MNVLSVAALAVIATVDWFDRIYLWLPFMYAATGNVFIAGQVTRPVRRADVRFEWSVRAVFGMSAAVLLADQVFVLGWREWFLPVMVLTLTAATLVYAGWDHRQQNGDGQGQLAESDLG